MDDFSQIAGEANAEQFKATLKALAGDFKIDPQQRRRDAPEPADRGHVHLGAGLRRDHPAGQGRHRDHVSTPSRIRPATRGDAPEIVDLLNACDVAEVGEPDSTLEDLENDWAMEGFDPARDAWVAEGPAGLVGYAYAGDQFRTGELEADLWVHPEHHEPELGGRLLGLAERRAAQLAVERGYPDPRPRRLLHGRQPGQARPAAPARLRAQAHRLPHDGRPRRRRAALARCPEGLEIRPVPARGRRARHVRHHDRGVRGPLPPEQRALRGLADPAARPRRTSIPTCGGSPGTATKRPAASSPTTTATSAGSRGSACAGRGGAAASAPRCSRTPSPRSRRADGCASTWAWTPRARRRPLRLYERAGMQPGSAYELYAAAAVRLRPPRLDAGREAGRPARGSSGPPRRPSARAPLPP